jgi:hypothetical protein
MINSLIVLNAYLTIWAFGIEEKIRFTIISISYKSDKGDMEIWRRRGLCTDEDLILKTEEKP